MELSGNEIYVVVKMTKLNSDYNMNCFPNLFFDFDSARNEVLEWVEHENKRLAEKYGSRNIGFLDMRNSIKIYYQETLVSQYNIFCYKKKDNEFTFVL